MKTATKMQQKPTANFELVSPKKAQEWLAKNTCNRNVLRRTVEYYKRSIHNAEWQSNGETIKFANDGTLLDGQHRLIAISEGEVTVELLVIRGLEKEAIKTIDNGKVRSPADHLRVHGFKGNVNVLAAASKLAMAFGKDGNYNFNHSKLSPTEIIDWVESNKHILYSLEKTPHSLGVLMPMSFAVGLHHIFWIKDEFKTEGFFQMLASGEGLSEGHPVLAMRTRLIANIDRRQWNASRRQIVSYMVQAFKAYCEGRKIKEIKYFPDSDIHCEWLV